MDSQEHIKRWRLILGKESQERFDAMGGGSLSEEDALYYKGLIPSYFPQVELYIVKREE